MIVHGFEPRIKTPKTDSTIFLIYFLLLILVQKLTEDEKREVERQCREDNEFNQLTRQAQKVKDQLKREQIALHVVTIELLLAHELIILPTTRMDKVSKAKKNRKRANVLRFGWFNERLRRQFQSRPSKIGFGIIWVGEEYTSCMCAKCGTFHGSLGPSKRFVCPDKNCGFSIDRDENGAWNIFFVGMAKVS